MIWGAGFWVALHACICKVVLGVVHRDELNWTGLDEGRVMKTLISGLGRRP